MQQLKVTDVRVHKGDSAFLIDDGKTAIMYDSGFAFTGFGVAEKVKALLGERKLDYIFLTHSHYDHALGSAYALKYWPSAKVVAGKYAAKIFAKPSAKALMRELDGKVAAQSNVTAYEDLIDELKVDVAVSDGEVIKAGDMQFLCIELPGHTRCSVGYYCAELKLLLASETIGVFNGACDVCPSYLVGYQMAIDSIERVEKLDIENILVPHYGLISGEQAAFYLAKGKQSAIEVASHITDMLRNGRPKEEAVQYFKDRFYHGYIKEIYPIDAMLLNTGIMIDLIERELV